MKLITETIEDIRVITEERGGKKNLYIEGVFLQAELKEVNAFIDGIAGDLTRLGK